MCRLDSAQQQGHWQSDDVPVKTIGQLRGKFYSDSRNPELDAEEPLSGRDEGFLPRDEEATGPIPFITGF